MGKTIGIFSLKGGVGKTTVVISLGSAIASFGKKVLLVDGNLSAPNLGISLEIINPEFSLQDVLERKAHPSQAVHKLGNFDVLPAGVFSNLNANPMQIKDKLGHLKRTYDYILIDSSPALNEETLGAMVASDEILVVTTPDYPTLNSTLKSVQLAKQRGTPISGLILNKVYDKKFEIPLKDIERTLDLPVMAVIPHDINFSKALSKFTSSVDFKPNSEASEEYRKLAATLIGENYKPIKLRHFLRWMNPQKQDVNRTIFYNRVFG
ncbi:MAG: AAA family ATPase [Candidatus Diapherotrites archaeon]